MKQYKPVKSTQKEIARIVGVSPSTVSMVMRGEGSISGEIRNRIFETANRIGYKKNSANNGAPKTTERDYVMILEYESFDYQWNFIKPFLLNLGNDLMKDQYFPIFYHLDKDVAWEQIEKTIVLSNCKGVCSIHYVNLELFRKLKQHGISVVVLNNNIFQKEFSAICVDDFQGVYNGMCYLVENGHKNILYFDYLRPDLEACVTDRYLGFFKAAEEFKIDYNNRQRITLILENKESLTKVFHKTLEENKDATAIFFHDDYLASWGIPEMKKMGLRIPEDISVIAPGDTLKFNEPFTPQFTTIRIDTGTMGKLASQLIKEKMENPESEIKLLKVTPTIVERGSCKKIG